MVRIQSVLGPIDSSDLGFTLSHEHVVVSSAGIPHIYPEFIRREESITEGIKQLREAKNEGLSSIIDVSTIDLGRDIRLIEQVSRESGINIICATGTWRDIPRAFWNATPDSVAKLYKREIEVGIEDTGIKAGIIKVANDVGGVTREGEVILRAAARTQKATGIPISTHTWAPDRVGEQQVRIFEDEGVDLNRVYIGHSNDTTDTFYLEGLMDKGVWLGLDWSVTLSIDSKEGQDTRKKSNPDGYLFITRKVLPRLREMGASQEQLDDLMINNPRRFFEGD